MRTTLKKKARKPTLKKSKLRVLGTHTHKLTATNEKDKDKDSDSTKIPLSSTESNSEVKKQTKELINNNVTKFDTYFEISDQDVKGWALDCDDVLLSRPKSILKKSDETEHHQPLNKLASKISKKSYLEEADEENYTTDLLGIKKQELSNNSHNSKLINKKVHCNSNPEEDSEVPRARTSSIFSLLELNVVKKKSMNLI